MYKAPGRWIKIRAELKNEYPLISAAKLELVTSEYDSNHPVGPANFPSLHLHNSSWQPP